MLAAELSTSSKQTVDDYQDMVIEAVKAQAAKVDCGVLIGCVLSEHTFGSTQEAS